MNVLKIVMLSAVTTTLSASADSGNDAKDAGPILERVWTNRASKDFSLKARLWVTREQTVPIEILVKNSVDETRTIYRGGKIELLAVQPIRTEVRFYRLGTGELLGPARQGKLLDSHFSFYDLGLPFLRWPNPKLTGEERIRGRDCFAVEAAATNEPYARVKMWIDKQYFALLRAEAFNADGDLIKRFAITSFKRIGEVWVPRALEVADVPPGQTLPAEERSRLEVYEGNYDTQLPTAVFGVENFSATATR